MSECGENCDCHNTETQKEQVTVICTPVPAQPVRAKAPDVNAIEEAILNKKLQFKMRLMEEDEKLYEIYDKQQKKVVKLPHRCWKCLDLATHVEVAGGDQMCVLYYCPEHAMKHTSKLQLIQAAIRTKREQEKNGDLPLHEVRPASDQGDSAEGQRELSGSEA